MILTDPDKSTTVLVNQKKSELIEWLRFFCVVCVVYLHAGIPFNELDLISYHNGIYDTIRILISHGLCRVAVPIFFIISGYLFFRDLSDWNTPTLTQKLKRRIRSLLIPYFIWNIISILFTYLSIRLYSIPREARLLDIRALWDTGTGLPQNYPLWFIRNLIVLDILAPIVHFYIKQTRLIGISILFILFFFNWWPRIPGLEAVGFFFYAFGAYLSITGKDLAEICNKYRIFAISIVVPLLAIMVLSYGDNPSLWEHTHRVFSLFGAIAVIGCAAHLEEKGRIRYSDSLSNSAFFIYAAHGTIALPFIQSLLRRLLPSTQDFAMILKYLTAPLLTILLLLLFYKLLLLFFPKTTSFLTGGRAGDKHSIAFHTGHTLLI